MFKYEKIIPFYDVDPMLITWHGNYVKYLEEARCAFLLSKNLTYLDMEKLGYSFPIVELKIKYIKPCTFGQHIVIKTNLASCANFIIFKYEIIDKDTGIKLCKAETKQMCVELSSKESMFEIPLMIQEGLK